MNNQLGDQTSELERAAMLDALLLYLHSSKDPFHIAVAMLARFEDPRILPKLEQIVEYHLATGKLETHAFFALRQIFKIQGNKALPLVERVSRTKPSNLQRLAKRSL